LRSTSAAPTYFTPAKIRNISKNGMKNPKLSKMINLDGGVFANNPTMYAYAEARNTNFKDRNNNEPSANDLLILSLGTGGRGYNIANKEKSNSWGLLKWAKLVPDIMMDASIDTVAYQMNEIFHSLGPSKSKNYLRINTPDKDRNYTIDMSDASSGNIQELLKAGQKTLEHAKINGLDEFLDELIDV
jgi:patatin-like phospholipase/acyl hydrolase